MGECFDQRLSFSVRTARPTDLAPLDTMFARSYSRLLRADYPPSLIVTAIPRLARAQPRLLASGTYYVAEDAGGGLVGAGGFSGGRGRGTPDRADVRHVVTDARWVRRGIGRAIMARTFADAAAAGFAWLHCQSSLTAVPFYAALGFVAHGEVLVPLLAGIDFPVVEMHRSLP